MREKTISEKKKRELIRKINEHTCRMFNKSKVKNVTLFNILAEMKMKDSDIYRLYEKEINKTRIIDLIVISIYEETWKEINRIIKILILDKEKSQDKILQKINKQLSKQFKTFPETVKFFVQGIKTPEDIGKTVFLKGLEDYERLFAELAPQTQPDVNTLLIFKD